MILAKKNRIPELAAERDGRARLRRFVRIYWPIVFATVGRHDPDGTPERWAQMADAMLAHLAIETGSGESCFCWNVGNIHATGEESARFHGRDSLVVGGPSSGVDFRAYFTMRGGVEDYVRVVSRSSTRWNTLRSESERAHYLVSLGRTGYFSNEPALEPSRDAAQAQLVPMIRNDSAPYRPGPETGQIAIAALGATTLAGLGLALWKGVL